MIHKTRVFNIVNTTVEKLAQDLIGCSSWTLCSGWRVGDTLFLNDSLSEDGALELAIVRVLPNGERVQFESVTFGWMNDDKVAEEVCNLVEEKYENFSIEIPLTIRDDHGDRCDLCR
jgi:hypothetical protein